MDYKPTRSVRGRTPKASADTPEAHRTSNGMWKNPLYTLIIPVMLVIGHLAVAAVFPIQNPIQAQTFEQLILSITKGIMAIAIPFAALAIVIAGFKFIVGGMKGNPGEVQKARTMFFWIIIGTAIVVGAYVIAQVAVNFARTLQ